MTKKKTNTLNLDPLKVQRKTQIKKDNHFEPAVCPLVVDGTCSRQNIAGGKPALSPSPK